MTYRFILFLCVTLALSGAAENSGSVVSKKDCHVWQYITYGPVQAPGKESGSDLSFLIGFGEKTEGFRFDILSGGGDNEPTAFKKGGIVVRLHRPDGNVIASTNSMGPIGVSGTWSIMSFFPWSTNDLEEAWVEASVQGETYWVEVPYGFTRNPKDSLSKSQKSWGPKRAVAMKQLGAHDHVVPWKDVHYDLGLIQNGWRLLLIQSNPFDGVSEVELYRDDSKVGKSMYLWDLHSPRTKLRIRDEGGGTFGGFCTDIRLHEDGMRRSDTYKIGRTDGDIRSWGRVEIEVDDKTYSIVVPSSLYKYTHGHPLQERGGKGPE